MTSNTSLKVLFVGDEIAVRETFSALIHKRLGINCQFANDSQEALEMIKDDTPDVLIADTKTPVQDGLNLIHNVRKRYPEILIFCD